MIVDFLKNFHQCVYAFLPGDFNFEWAKIACGATRGTKQALLFIPVMNYVLVDFDECFKGVDDLSALLKFPMDKSQAIPQF